MKNADDVTMKTVKESATNQQISPATPTIPTTPLEILLDVVQKLSLAKDLETIMYIVRKAARKLVNADGATFVLRDNDQCYYADEDAIAPLWKGKRFPMSTCISGWVMEHRQPAVIEDIYADPRIPADAYRPTFVKSLAMMPIRTSAPLGAIGTYWADHYKPTEEQLNLLKSLADSTSVALENIQLHTELEKGAQETTVQVEITKKLIETNKNLEETLSELNRRSQEMEWLKELSSNLQTCVYIEESYKLIAQYSTLLLPHVAGVLYSMHPSRNYLESMFTWNHPSLKEKIIKPEECLALRRGTLYQVNNPSIDLLCEHHKENAYMGSYVCVPLFAQSDIMGLLYMEMKDVSDQPPVGDNQHILISMIAEQAAIGISNIRLRETLRNQSLRDVLTGLYNRRYLEETLEREISRCARKSSSLTVMMLDVDHFKQFNDKFGHEAGDIVLQSLAHELRNFARKEDIPCRYGGEEFVFVMPETDLTTAMQRAEMLHENISKIHLRYGGVALTQITVSIGVAMYPAHGENIHDLIAASDIALYEAKNSGRNKTVIYKKNVG